MHFYAYSLVKHSYLTLLPVFGVIMVDGVDGAHRVDEADPEVWARVTATPPKQIYTTWQNVTYGKTVCDHGIFDHFHLHFYRKSSLVHRQGTQWHNGLL